MSCSLNMPLLVAANSAAGVLFGVLFVSGSILFYPQLNNFGGVENLGPTLGAWFFVIGSVLYFVMAIQEMVPLINLAKKGRVKVDVPGEDPIKNFRRNPTHRFSMAIHHATDDGCYATDDGYNPPNSVESAQDPWVEDDDAESHARGTVGINNDQEQQLSRQSMLLRTKTVKYFFGSDAIHSSSTTAAESFAEDPQQQNLTGRQKMRWQLINSSLYIISAILFIIGSVYFLPTMYAKNDILGVTLFIVGCLLYWIAASWDTARLLKRGEMQSYLDFTILFLPVVGSILFIIGCLFFYPRYLVAEFDVIYAVSYFVAGSCFFLMSSLLKPISVSSALAKLDHIADKAQEEEVLLHHEIS